jgi:hypothetical protein
MCIFWSHLVWLCAGMDLVTGSQGIVLASASLSSTLRYVPNCHAAIRASLILVSCHISCRCVLTKMRRVEMWAVTESGEDWPFCVDDIRIRFHNATESEIYETLETPRSWENIEMREQGLFLHAQRSM